MRRAKKEAGVTLLELMVTLVVLGILVSLALPSFSTFLANTKLRAVADSLFTGLQVARMEAIKGNRTTAFRVFNGNNDWVIYDTSAAIVTGNVCGSTDTPQANQIQRSCSENAGATLSPDTTASTLEVVFNAQGRATAAWTRNGCADNNTGRGIASTSPGILIGTASTTSQLCILVGAGGQIRLCDPNNGTANDPRNCDS